MEKEISCNIVKVGSKKNAQWQSHVSTKNCPWSNSIKVSPETCLCAAYKEDEGVYCCPFMGSGQVIVGEKGYQYNTYVGRSTVFCTK